MTVFDLLARIGNLEDESIITIFIDSTKYRIYNFKEIVVNDNLKYIRELDVVRFELSLYHSISTNINIL